MTLTCTSILSYFRFLKLGAGLLTHNGKPIGGPIFSSICHLVGLPVVREGPPQANVVTDDDLALLASCSGLKELVLVCCNGFGTSGLGVVASACRWLQLLNLIESDVSDDEVDWILCFIMLGVCYFRLCGMRQLQCLVDILDYKGNDF